MMIKLCGIKRPQDIEYINEFIPDYIGFILADGYKRTISVEYAKELTEKLNPYTKTVGVFVNQPVEFIKNAVDKIGLSAYQLHGDEDAEYIKKARSLIDADVWKAVRVRSQQDIINADNLGADMLVIDSFTENVYGGSGKTADWNLIRNTKINTQYFLAGGIDINNINEALEITAPYNGIDISSGIETNGFKDRNKIAEIMKSAENFYRNIMR